MAYMSELERKAWESREGSNSHKPPMAMKAALDFESTQIDRPVKHAIVILVHDDDGDDLISYFQAGSLSEYAMEGALMRTIRINQDG